LLRNHIVHIFFSQISMAFGTCRRRLSLFIPIGKINVYILLKVQVLTIYEICVHVWEFWKADERFVAITKASYSSFLRLYMRRPRKYYIYILVWNPLRVNQYPPNLKVDVEFNLVLLCVMTCDLKIFIVFSEISGAAIW